jgi:hypothetical protein
MKRLTAPKTNFDEFLNDAELTHPLRRLFRMQDSADPVEALAATKFLATLIYGPRTAATAQPARFELPSCDTPAGIVEALDGLARAVAGKRITGKEADSVRSILALKLTAMSAVGVEEQIEELQAQVAQNSPKNMRNAGLVLAMPRK